VLSVFHSSGKQCAADSTRALLDGGVAPYPDAAEWEVVTEADDSDGATDDAVKVLQIKDFLGSHLDDYHPPIKTTS